MTALNITLNCGQHFWVCWGKYDKGFNESIKIFEISFRPYRTDCSTGIPCYWRLWLPRILIPNSLACRSDINSWPACSLFLRIHQSVREKLANKRFESIIYSPNCRLNNVELKTLSVLWQVVRGNRNNILRSK